VAGEARCQMPLASSSFSYSSSSSTSRRQTHHDAGDPSGRGFIAKKPRSQEAKKPRSQEAKKPRINRQSNTNHDGTPNPSLLALLGSFAMKSRARPKMPNCSLEIADLSTPQMSRTRTSRRTRTIQRPTPNSKLQTPNCPQEIVPNSRQHGGIRFAIGTAVRDIGGWLITFLVPVGPRSGGVLMHR